MKNCKYVTVELLKTILVCLPNLEVLNNALMIEALVDLAKNTGNTGQSLIFLNGGLTFNTDWTKTSISI